MTLLLGFVTHLHACKGSLRINTNYGLMGRENVGYSTSDGEVQQRTRKCTDLQQYQVTALVP